MFKTRDGGRAGDRWFVISVVSMHRKFVFGVALYTGFSDELTKMNKKVDPALAHAMCCVLDGRDSRLLKWITDSQIAALIADNYGVEAVPAKPGPDNAQHPSLPIHNHCLFKLGLNLGEIWWLRDLALWLRDNKRSRFLLTAPPLRLPGAVGSPATPVATVHRKHGSVFPRSPGA